MGSPARQELEPEARVLVDVFSEQIRQRYLDEDLTKHKHILFHEAVLKQLVLYPNGASIMTKLGSITGASVEKGRAAFDKGKQLISELCDLLEGPTLRELSQQNLLASAPAHSFRSDPLSVYSLDDSDDEDAGRGTQPAHRRVSGSVTDSAPTSESVNTVEAARPLRE